MALPCDYMETSMSGKGVHMIFKNVPTNFPDIKLAKNALKANDNTIITSYKKSFKVTNSILL